MFRRHSGTLLRVARTAGALMLLQCTFVERALSQTVDAGQTPALPAAVSPDGAQPLTTAGALETAAAAAGAVLYRIFLRDGTMIVSYGEYAHVADRIVASIPIGGTDTNPVLHVLTIPEAEVEWDRTNTYAQAARARHYAATRGEADFAALTRQVAGTLNQIGEVSDAGRRLALAEAARRQLVEWPRQHYGYRAAELAQMTTWLDQVVSELRVAAGHSSFDLALVATPPAEGVPDVQLLPAPNLRERVEFGLIAARRSADTTERVSLLRSVLDSLQPGGGGRFPEGSWMAAVHARASADLAEELRTSRAYAAITNRALARASSYLARADVRALEALIPWVLAEDRKLNGARPAEVAALLSTLDAKIDAARRLRLARDAWVLRTARVREYWRQLRQGLDRLLGLREWLVDVRQLAGPSPGALRRLAVDAARAQRELARVQPPPEAANAHSTLAAAVAMAMRAAAARSDAVQSGSMDQAWQASSAAAGSLMLLDRAVDDLRLITRAAPPR